MWNNSLLLVFNFEIRYVFILHSESREALEDSLPMKRLLFCLAIIYRNIMLTCLGQNSQGKSTLLLLWTKTCWHDLNQLPGQLQYKPLVILSAFKG